MISVSILVMLYEKSSILKYVGRDAATMQEYFLISVQYPNIHWSMASISHQDKNQQWLHHQSGICKGIIKRIYQIFSTHFFCQKILAIKMTLCIAWTSNRNVSPFSLGVFDVIYVDISALFFLVLSDLDVGKITYQIWCFSWYESYVHIIIV